MWLEMTSLCDSLEASSFTLFPQVHCSAPASPPCVFSSVHPFSVWASGFLSQTCFYTSPDPPPSPQDFCAEVLLVCNSSLPPLCSHCIFLAVYWMLPVLKSHRHLHNPVYHLLKQPALPPQINCQPAGH